MNSDSQEISEAYYQLIKSNKKIGPILAQLNDAVKEILDFSVVDFETANHSHVYSNDLDKLAEIFYKLNKDDVYLSIEKKPK